MSAGERPGGSAAPAGPRIGLVLGSGAARGWAHIGVIEALQREGIQPHLVCGCSIGAFVGAALAAGYLERLSHWVGHLKWQDVASLMDISLKGGLIKGRRLIHFFEQNFVDRDFSALPQPFACVATDLKSGREVWLRDGSVARAVRASIALPGLLTPVPRDGRLLVDGGLVNPVPVSLARAMGADVVIAVDLGSDMVGRALRPPRQEPAEPSGQPQGWGQRVLAHLGWREDEHGEADLPSLLSVLTSSINVMQVRIARSRLAGEPADVLISPRLGQLGPMDYHRGQEAMAEGEAAVKRALPAIHHALEMA